MLRLEILAVCSISSIGDFHSQYFDGSIDICDHLLKQVAFFLSRCAGVGLTTDGWSSDSGVHFITLTAHGVLQISGKFVVVDFVLSTEAITEGDMEAVSAWISGVLVRYLFILLDCYCFFQHFFSFIFKDFVWLKMMYLVLQSMELNCLWRHSLGLEIGGAFVTGLVSLYMMLFKSERQLMGVSIHNKRIVSKKEFTHFL